MATRAWIDFIEDGYRLDGSEEAWLAALLSSAPFTARDGVAGYTFEQTPQAVELRAVTQADADIDLIGPTARLHELGSAGSLDAMYRSGMVTGTMSETIFVHHPEVGDAYAELSGGRFLDAIGVVARDGRGAGCALTEVLRRPRQSTAVERARWLRASAHLGAGQRLRRRLSSLALDDLNVEAIFDADGTLKDASGPARSASARERLRHAIQAMDKARLRGADPDETLELWRALVDGRWSIVDHFDSDGRRFVVARRNDIADGDPRGLTPRELEVAELSGLGESNKAIAYRLDISEAAVSAAVRRAMRKLGLAGRTELASFFAPMGPRWKLVRTDLGGEPLLVARSAGLRSEILEALTSAEREVALEVVAGSTNAAIATRRGRSPSTVANQVAAIFEQLGVSSRSELSVLLTGAPGSMGERGPSGAAQTVA